MTWSITRTQDPITFTAFAVVIASLIGSGCAPVFSDFQSARILEPGQMEVTPSFNSVSFTEGGETNHTQYNAGLEVGIGITPSVEIRGAYYRIIVSDERGQDFNVLGFGPKLGVVKDRLAVFIPFGFAFSKDFETPEWEVHPTILFTASSENFEITPSIKALLPISGEGRETLLAFNLGAGINPGQVGLMIRPEVGLLINPGESGAVLTIGAGLSYRFGGSKRSGRSR